MTCLAIIPARGGSKRIPRKNVKEFLGKPIIAYSIQVAFESQLFDEIMVSTDDNEVASIAKNFGARVPFLRSDINSSDHARTADVIIEVLNCYKAQGRYFDYACCIYPAAPLLKTNSLINAFNTLKGEGRKTVFPVVPFGFPIWRSLKIEQEKIVMIWPEHKNTRSQDLPKAWHDAGQFYWLSVPDFYIEPSLYTSNSGWIELSELEVQDIDNIDDWKVAEFKAQLSK